MLRKIKLTRSLLSLFSFCKKTPSHSRPQRLTLAVPPRLELLEDRVTPAILPPYVLSTLAVFNATSAAGPYGVIRDSNGNLYGTTTIGGTSSDGTVFEVAEGSGTITTLATFSGANGAYPSGSLLRDSSGNLFGTTSGGGPLGDGTVFELANGSDTITTLASFNSTGSIPQGNLAMDANGNLYGTTVYGGADEVGTVFEVAKGSGTITTLVTFNGVNGAYPVGGVIMDGSGNLYGTTAVSIFELANGSSTVTTLATVSGVNGDGLIMDSSGDLYGATFDGGASNDGTVFELAKGSGTITTLASFDGSDGLTPQGLIMDGSGDLYGETAFGGTGFNGSTDLGYGTVFEVANGSGTITTLADFTGTNGSYPAGTLATDGNGNLYGVTESTSGLGGTVFELSPALITASTDALNLGTSRIGTAGSSQTFTVAGSNLTADIVLTAPTGVELSDNGGQSYSASLDVAESAGMVASTTILARIAATALPGSISGVIAIDSTGAAAQGIAVSGSAAVLTVSPASLPAASVGQFYSQQLTTTGGTGTGDTFRESGYLDGLTLSSTGLLSGTPASTIGSPFSFTVTVTDSAGNSGSQTYSLVVQVTAATAVALNLSSPTSVYGEAVTITATVAPLVSGPETPTGTVTFYRGAVGAILLGTASLTSGSGSLMLSNLPAGLRLIYASYSGDTNFSASSTPVSVSLTVNPSSSNTSVSATPTIVYGQPATLTATVTAQSPGHGVPTGTVTFYRGSIGGIFVGTATLSGSGVASLAPDSPLPAGPRDFFASYAGDGNFLSSNSPSTTSAVMTIQGSTATTVSLASATAVFGQAVTIKASVAFSVPSSVLPSSGTVSFYRGAVGAILLGTATLDNGVASLTLSNLPVGLRLLYASYSGDTYSLPSSSVAASSLTINQAGSTIALLLSSTSLPFGQPLTLTANVSAVLPGAGTPTGTVTFYRGAVGAILLGTATLTNGTASFTISDMPVGQRDIYASYSGDVDFLATSTLNTYIVLVT